MMAGHDFCFDGCVAAGGQLIFDTEGTGPIDCEVDLTNCPRTAIYEVWDGSTIAHSSCDYTCLNSGGRIAEIAHTYRKEQYCLYDEMGCRFEFIDENGQKMCDTWCAPHNGIVTSREDDSGRKYLHCDFGTHP